MTVLQDLMLFFAMPTVVIVWALLAYRGSVPCGYKIVRETDSLDQHRYEVWFEYPTMFWNPYSWCLKAVFYTEQSAIEYVARQQAKKREIIKTGLF